MSYETETNAAATNPPQTTGIPFKVFDLEIAKSVEDTPNGWEGARRGLSGFGCGCIYSSESNRTILYGPQDVEAFGEALEGPFVVVSFNGEGFDVPVIEGITGRKLEIRTHLDLLSLLVRTTGQRKGLKLDNIAQKTLGTGKSGSGAEAPKMYQRGLLGDVDGVQNIVTLLNYCSLDVTITRDLLQFLMKNGFVIGPNGPIHPVLPPYFAQLQR